MNYVLLGVCVFLGAVIIALLIAVCNLRRQIRDVRRKNNMLQERISEKTPLEEVKEDIELYTKQRNNFLMMEIFRIYRTSYSQKIKLKCLELIEHLHE